MISGLPKELNELAVLYDADNSSVQAGSYLTWPSIDLLKGLAAGRQKLNSWLIGGTDRLAKLAMESGLAMFDRYTESGNADQLDRAIELYREALSLRRTGHPDRATSLFMLGCLLYMRYEQTGNVALLNEAIELKREALVLQPPGHPSRSNTCNLLGFSLHARFEHTGDAALLDEVIEVEREALALRPPGHPDRSTSCDNLAASLFVRYEQTGNVALLHEAIEVEREALALRPPGHRRRPGSCVHLATLLTMRSNRTGDITPLNEATELEREATKLGSSDHSSQPMTGATLTNSLYARYEQTGDVALLEKAIELEREGLGLRPPGHPHQAKISASLASSLSARFIQTGNVALMDKAIGFHREALVLQPPGHHDQASSCVGLVMLLSLRYKQTRDVALLDEAVAICSYTLKYSSASQVWYPLTQLSFIHLIRGSPHFSALEALVYLDRSFQHGVDNIPAFISQVCLIVRLIWDDSSTWAPHIRVTVLLVGVYAQLVDRLPLVAGFVLDTSSRLRTLKETHHIGSDACVAALLAEQPATAVELLDRAHGLVWTQALHQRDPQMEGAPKDLAIELEDLLRAIGTSVPVDPAGHLDHPQDVRHRQDTRIQIILREIRAIPGLARFMLGSTYDTLREAAREHPVVVLVAARDHAFALIMPSSLHAGPDILRLDVASHTLQSFANSVGPANMRYRACSPSCEDVHLADSAIGLGPDRKMGPGDHFTQRSPLVKLWLSVVKPVLTHLGLAKQEDPSRRPRLHWCTAGDFAPLPVHAAGIYAGVEQECCSDYVVSSYTPTLATLLRARRDLQPVPTADAKLLLVAADHAATAQLAALPNVQAEMSGITRIADRAGIQYAASSRTVATPEEATAALPSATLVHIACHGTQHPEQPLESAFHLSNDGVLSVSNLMELNLKGAYLAFLSACETAKGDREQSDQAIHLAATMLFVGFKSVVATMWAMRDADGPIVSKAFYEKLFEGEMITADSIPYALDHAVRELRKSGVPIGNWATFIHVGA